MSQTPSPSPPRTHVSALEPPHVGIGIRTIPSAVVAFCAVLALSALRLLVYALLAHGFGGLSHGLCNFDCGWYEHTARAGYDLAPDGDRYSNTANWAFFPLFPLLLAIVSAVIPLSGGMTWAGILLSTACFAGFATLGLFYLQASEGDVPAPAMGMPRRSTVPTAIAWLCLVSLWPGDIYFTFPYSEALYALLLTASLLALTRRDPLTAALWSAAVSAARPPGILTAPVIVADRWRYLQRCYRGGTLHRMPITTVSRALLPVAVAPLGLFAFMAYLRWHMGDGLAFVHVQSAWNRHAMLPWTALWDGLRANDWWRVLARPTQESLSIEAAFGIGGLLLAARQCRAGRYAEAWLIGGTVLLACSAGLQSLPRFVLSNPIVILALFRLVAGGATQRRLILIGAALGLLQLLFIWAWFMGAPALA